LVHSKQRHLMRRRIGEMERGLRVAHCIGKRPAAWDDHHRHARASYNVQDGS
jgi:hypothetical protein